MVRALISSLRRMGAGVLLVGGVLSAVWVADFKVWYAYFYEGVYEAPVPHSACIHTNLMCTAVSPVWTIPVGIVIGVLGVLAAALVYSPSRVRPALSRSRTSIAPS